MTVPVTNTEDPSGAPSEAATGVERGLHRRRAVAEGVRLAPLAVVIAEDAHPAPGDDAPTPPEGSTSARTAFLLRSVQHANRFPPSILNEAEGAKFCVQLECGGIPCMYVADCDLEVL